MAVKYLLNSLNADDAIIVVGQDLCKEAYQHDDERVLYLPNNFDQSMAIATGIAMTNTRRVFFICEDHYLLNNLSTAAQTATTRSKNIFLVVFITSTYQFVDNMPNIFNSMPRPKSILFDMGFTTHDYSKMFQYADGAKTTGKKLKNARGPLSIFIEVDQGIKEIEDIDFDLKANLKRFTEFLATSEEN